MDRMVNRCGDCKGSGLVPASPDHRWMLMDCPRCSPPPESVEEQAERLRERARLLEANIGHQFRYETELAREHEAEKHEVSRV